MRTVEVHHANGTVVQSQSVEHQRYGVAIETTRRALGLSIPDDAYWKLRDFRLGRLAGPLGHETYEQERDEPIQVYIPYEQIELVVQSR